MTEVVRLHRRRPACSGHRVGDQCDQGRPPGRDAHRHRVRHRRRRLRRRRGRGAAVGQGTWPRHAGAGARRVVAHHPRPGLLGPASARELIRAFWPGALSLVVHRLRRCTGTSATPQGTVMLRMPLHPVAIELLREVGPMAVSSANISGRPAAVTAATPANNSAISSRSTSRVVRSSSRPHRRSSTSRSPIRGCCERAR